MTNKKLILQLSKVLAQIINKKLIPCQNKVHTHINIFPRPNKLSRKKHLLKKMKMIALQKTGIAFS